MIIVTSAAEDDFVWRDGKVRALPGTTTKKEHTRDGAMSLSKGYNTDRTKRGPEKQDKVETESRHAEDKEMRVAASQGVGGKTQQYNTIKQSRIHHNLTCL